MELENKITDKKYDGPVADILNDPKFIKKFKLFADDPTRNHLFSPECISSVARKIWHIQAEQLGLYSISIGEGRNRRVIISKKPFEEKDNMIISTTSMKSFRDYNDININMADFNDFEYFIDLYNARSQLNEFIYAMNEIYDKYHKKQLGLLQPSEELYKAEFTKEDTWGYVLLHMKEIIHNDITAGSGYQNLLTANLDTFRNECSKIYKELHKLNIKINKKTIYTVENNDKYYFSIDIKAANCNSFIFYDPSILLGHPNWISLIRSYTSNSNIKTLFFEKSKLFRQKIFWRFNQKRQATIWEYLIMKILYGLVKNTTIEFIHANIVQININADEIIFELTNKSCQNKLIDLWNQILSDKSIWTSECDDIHRQILPEWFRLNSFQLNIIETKHKFMVKSNYIYDAITLDRPKIQFIGVPIQWFAVVWKKWYGLDINDKDLKLRWDTTKDNWIYSDITELNFINLNYSSSSWL